MFFLIAMIGSIDHQADIDLYLEAEELRRLENGTIEGVLVKARHPKRQGTISISVNEARKNENGCGRRNKPGRPRGVKAMKNKF